MRPAGLAGPAFFVIALDALVAGASQRVTGKLAPNGRSGSTLNGS